MSSLAILEMASDGVSTPADGYWRRAAVVVTLFAKISQELELVVVEPRSGEYMVHSTEYYSIVCST